MPAESRLVGLTAVTVELGGRLKSCAVKSRHGTTELLTITFEPQTAVVIPGGDTFILEPADTFPLSAGTIKTEKIGLVADAPGFVTVVWTTWEVVPKTERGFLDRLAEQFGI